MTYQELLTEFSRLPLDERLALLEALTHNLRAEPRPPAAGRRRTGFVVCSNRPEWS